MATEQIRINYVVDKKQLDASNKSLKTTAKENDLVQKEVDQTNDKFKDQEKQLSKTNKAFAGLGGQLQSIGNRFQIAGRGMGDMAAGMFKTTKATSLTSKAMKVLKFAIASTGVGVLVIALGSLVTYFTKSQSGSDKLSKAMGALSAIVDTIIGRFAKVGEGLAAIFSGDFSKGADILKASFAGIVDELAGAVKGSLEYEDMLVRLRKREIEVTASVAKRTKIIQEQLLATKNNTLSFVEQKKALDLVEKLQIENEKDLLDLAQQRLDIVKKDLENTPEALRMDEQRLEVANAQRDFDVEIANSKARQRDTANRQTELANRILATTKAQQAEEAKIAKEKQDSIDKEEAKRLEQAEADAQTLEEKKQAISDLAVFKLEQDGLLEQAELERRNRLLENEELIEEERQLIIAQSEANIVAIKEDAAEKKKVIKEKSDADEIATDKIVLDSKAKAADELLGIAKQFASDGSALGKAVALTSIAQDTGRAISGLTAASEGNPANAVTFGGAGIIQFITGLARIGLNINNARSLLSSPTKFEKGGRIGGNLHSGGGTMIEAERDEFMMSRKATNKYGFDLMNKINNLELNDLSMGSDGASINIIDTKLIAEQLKNMPQNIMNVDSEGFALHQRRGQYMMSQKIERYST